MTTEQNGEEKGGQSVPISQRVTDTLYALTQSSGVLSVRTIAEATGNSRSSTHRILQALAESQYAEQREDGGYTVGRRLVELAARVFGVVPVLKIVDDIMTGLVAEVGETCYLATYTEGETFATFVHRVESNHSVRHVQALGTQAPAARRCRRQGDPVGSRHRPRQPRPDGVHPADARPLSRLSRRTSSPRGNSDTPRRSRSASSVWTALRLRSSPVTPSSAVSPSPYPPHALPKAVSRPSAASCANERTSCRRP